MGKEMGKEREEEIRSTEAMYRKARYRAHQLKHATPATIQGQTIKLCLHHINYCLDDVERRARNWGNYAYILSVLQSASTYLERIEELAMELELAR